MPAWLLPVASLVISGAAAGTQYSAQRRQRKTAERNAAATDALAMRDNALALEDANLAAAQQIVLGSTEATRQASVARAMLAEGGVGGNAAQAILRDVALGISEFAEAQRQQTTLNRRDTERNMRQTAQGVAAQLAGVPRASVAAAALRFAADGIGIAAPLMNARGPGVSRPSGGASIPNIQLPTVDLNNLR